MNDKPTQVDNPEITEIDQEQQETNNRAPSTARRSTSAMKLLALTTMFGGFGGLGGGRSASAERHDPDREKTPKDLERMKAAQDKRDKRAARKSNQNK